MQHDRALVSFWHGMAPLALASAAMIAGKCMRGRGRSWMAAEVRDAIRWFNAGMTHREIAVALDRSESAVQQKLAGFRHSPKGTVLPPDGDSLQMAKRALAFELAVARSERATAPLLRSWPSGLWP